LPTLTPPLAFAGKPELGGVALVRPSQARSRWQCPRRKESSGILHLRVLEVWGPCAAFQHCPYRHPARAAEGYGVPRPQGTFAGSPLGGTNRRGGVDKSPARPRSRWLMRWFPASPVALRVVLRQKKPCRPFSVATPAGAAPAILGVRAPLPRNPFMGVAQWSYERLDISTANVPTLSIACSRRWANFRHADPAQGNSAR
jgi:hypothetical protein